MLCTVQASVQFRLVLARHFETIYAGNSRNLISEVAKLAFPLLHSLRITHLVK